MNFPNLVNFPNTNFLYKLNSLNPIAKNQSAKKDLGMKKISTKGFLLKKSQMGKIGLMLWGIFGKKLSIVAKMHPCKNDLSVH